MRRKDYSPIRPTTTLIRFIAGVSWRVTTYLVPIGEPTTCSWDTFRTFYPLMALHSPVQYAQIVDNYIDAYLTLGWMPDCRANNLPGWTQGGTLL